jgi:hypothetical protein
MGMFIQDWPLVASSGTVRNGGHGRASKWQSYVYGAEPGLS